MPELLNINVNQKGSDLTVPVMRQSRFMAFLRALLAPLTKKQSDIANVYIGGTTYSNYNAGNTYQYGDRVSLPMLAGNASYEYINSMPSAGKPVSDVNYWYKISSDLIGLNERLNYNASKMQLEYILNRRFSPATVAPPYDAAHGSIYIVTNQSYAPILWSGQGNGSSKFCAPNSSNSFFYCPTEAGIQGYINSKNYTIWIPLATLTAISLGGNIVDGKKMMSAEVDKYNIAGMTYGINTY